MSKRRKRIGSRRYRATIQQHDGTVDTHGNPTYKTDADWDNFVCEWPCELLTVRGGENIRGRQVAEETTHVLFGEYFGAEGVTAKMRLVIDSVQYGIVSAFDPEGDRREMRIEAKREH